MAYRDISATTNPDKTALSLSTPYLPAFAARAKALGGRWNPDSKRWTFDYRDRPAVLALCEELYGYTWIAPTEPERLVDVKITFGDSCHYFGESNVVIGGRIVLSRPGRDMTVRLDGATLEGATFDAHGGSAKYPVVGNVGGTLTLRDLPANLIDTDPTLAAIRKSYGDAAVEVIPQDAPQPAAPTPVLDLAVEAVLAAFEALTPEQQAAVRGRL